MSTGATIGGRAKQNIDPEMAIRIEAAATRKDLIGGYQNRLYELFGSETSQILATV
jgi:hypothetical protein